MLVLNNVIEQRKDRAYGRGQNLGQEPRTKARVATTLLRRGTASSTRCFRTLCHCGPSLPNGENVGNESIEAKATRTLISSI